MKTIEELQDRLAEIDARQKVLLGAKGHVMSAEEMAEFDTLDTELETVLCDIAAIRKAEADSESRRKKLESRPTPTTGRRSSHPTPSAPRVVESQEEKWASDPKKGFSGPREFMTSVIEVGRGMGQDDRLRFLTVGSDEARGNSDPAGGFLIPEAFSPNLLKLDPEDDPIGGRTTRMPMASTIVKIPARVDKNHSTSVSGGLTVTRRPETVAASASQMTFEQVTVEAHGLFGLSYATEEILTDSPISFAAILSAGFSEQFTGHLIRERIRGVGAGEMQGILNAACLVTVSKETGQAADTINKENIDKMRSRCWGYGKAVWLANYDTLPQLRSLSMSVGTAGVPVPYFQQEPGGQAYLDGRPLIFTEYASTLGDVGDLILGNWSEYLEGIYQPMQSAESMHVRFVNHERAFKFWMRNGGAPWWKTAMTPQNGTNTLSPFVVLEAR